MFAPGVVFERYQQREDDPNFHSIQRNFQKFLCMYISLFILKSAAQHAVVLNIKKPSQSTKFKAFKINVK
ncbi:CLUMA_CG017211, isoform A [Clunio marinus]|uniref:CLUMA_CG017211, isoform A n=1 Tax=Clunio marinus TaxID=568069 RepID=A0A1J1IWN3_9DIPT|nr:CLUMA_CG017211, isoform A [Clunio marinus]